MSGSRFAVLFCITAALVAFAAAAPGAHKPRHSQAAKVMKLKVGISWHRTSTWRWQDIALVRRTRSSYAERTTRSVPYLRWLARTWSERRAAARRHASSPPHYREWMCIHRYEGAWNDPSSPYYGGLQMDMSFQRAHGWDALARWGTADNWHPLTQMWVAERAHGGWRGSTPRGFYPWPNTARYCHLL
jgi:hypothetical protein